MKNQTGSARLVVIIVAIIIALGGAGFYVWQNYFNKSTSNSVTAVTERERDEPEPVEAQATISGIVRYPIEWIDTAARNKGEVFPTDLRICAVTTDTNKKIACDSGFSASRETYTLSVPEGSYLIEATTGQKVAYYDLYVKDNPNNEAVEPCDAETSKPIILNVKKGDTLVNIHAADFWVGNLGC